MNITNYILVISKYESGDFMNDVIFLTAINSDISNIGPTVKNILFLLSKNIPYISKEDIIDIKLILSEAISNAIIHGNHRDKNKQVVIKAIIINNTEVMFKIEDEGYGFDYKNILKNIKFQDIYREDGRGFLLIDSLSDNIEFFKNGRELHIRKTVVHDYV